jgi:hypothetical protein
MLYNKTFLQMQRDYMELNDLIAKMKETQLKQYISEDGATSQYEKYKNEYNKLNSKIYATAMSLKEYFVENNEEFNKTNFNFSLSFFNGYAIMENTPMMQVSDYQKLNSEFLEDYKEDLKKILVAKKEQYNALNSVLRAQKQQYNQEFKEDVQKSNNTSARGKALISKFAKDLNQREAIYKKVHFIEKEIKTIDSVLGQYQIKG